MNAGTPWLRQTHDDDDRTDDSQTVQAAESKRPINWCCALLNRSQDLNCARAWGWEYRIVLLLLVAMVLRCLAAENAPCRLSSTVKKMMIMKIIRAWFPAAYLVPVGDVEDRSCLTRLAEPDLIMIMHISA